jgi:hypothetical protein
MVDKEYRINDSAKRTILVIFGCLIFILFSSRLEISSVFPPETTPTPTVDPVFSIPPALARFTNQYRSFTDLTQRFWTDSGFTYGEVNHLDPGQFNASPLVSLQQKTGDCFELAALAALFGEVKYGYPPYILILIPRADSGIDDHGIYPFQDLQSGAWGYVDSFREYQQPALIDINSLANFYVENHPLPNGRYDTWVIIDLSKSYENGSDWWSTITSIPINQSNILANGEFQP